MKKLILSALACCVFGAQAKITIQGENIKNCGSHSGRSITLASKPEVYAPETDNLTVCLQDNDLTWGSIELHSTEQLADVYYNLLSNSFLNRVHATKKIKLHAQKAHTFTHAALVAQEAVILKSQDSINLTQSVLGAQEVHLAADNINFNTVAIDNPHTVLYLYAVSYDSVIKAIRITFNRETKMPYVINGICDLKNGSTEKPLIIVGADTVDILFGDQAFE